MEMWGDLLRWNATDSRWYSLHICDAGVRPGPGTQLCTTYYDCSHPFTTRRYKTVTTGYAVRNGIGYFGVDYSAEVVTECN